MSTLTKLKENIESVIQLERKGDRYGHDFLNCRRSYSIGGRSWNGQNSYGQVACPLFGCLFFPCTVYTRFAAI